MKRLLIIAYSFPPLNEVGRMRTIKFCKYLPEFGWQGVVVTGNMPRRYSADLLNEIPETAEVHRAGNGSTLQQWLSRAAKCRNFVKSLLPHSNGKSAVTTPLAAAASAENSFSQRLKRYMEWPDLEWTWIGPAARRAIKIAKTCDAIYSSGWPMSCHIVGYRAAKASGLPWIMDNRDPWTLNMTYQTQMQNNHFKRLEAKLIATSNCVINVTEPWTQKFKEAFPDNEPKFVTLPNGFDPADFQDLPASEKTGPLTLTYIGSLYGGRTSLPLLNALKELIDSGQVNPAEIRLQFIGETGNEGEVAQQMGLSQSVVYSPRIPYRSALEKLGRSHVALVLGGKSVDRLSSPTKIYEYYCMNKPMLAVLPQGNLWQRLESTGVSCVSGENTSELKTALMNLLALYRSGKDLPVPSQLPEMQQYSRRNITAGLAEILDKAIEDRQAQAAGTLRTGK